jgi:hypothetical protein
MEVRGIPSTLGLADGLLPDDVRALVPLEF